MIDILLAATVVLLSIDGLKPDYVLEADGHGLRIPNLRRLVAEGAHASGVQGVLPTVTYPSHATMLTGVGPETHTIYENHAFDPFAKNLDGWYWYFEDIAAPTLWDLVDDDASVDWPVSVGAPVRYNIVQYWRAATADDLKLIRALSTPGLLPEAEAVVGPYPDGNDYGLEADRRRTRFIEYVIAEKEPVFLTGYLAALDTEQHASGPASRETFETLEALDELVGRLREVSSVLCVVSDHGFLPSETELHLNAAFHDAGLLEASESGSLLSWRAFARSFGGSAAVIVRDDGARERARNVLERLAGDPRNGIDELVEGSWIPGAFVVVGMKQGFRLGGSLTSPVLREGPLSGTHGYLPSNPAMDAAFFVAGEGIPSGRALGRVDMRDIAPTLAAILGVALPSAEGRNLLER